MVSVSGKLSRMSSFHSCVDVTVRKLVIEEGMLLCSLVLSFTLHVSTSYRRYPVHAEWDKPIQAVYRSFHLPEETVGSVFIELLFTQLFHIFRSEHFNCHRLNALVSQAELI